jgi:F0F1-type ATP synthase assembly protein I
MAKAMDWVTRITTISVMMVLPALGGYYLDQRFGTVAVFLFLGMLLGIAAAAWQLYKLVQFREKQFEQEEAARKRRG